MQVCDTGPGIPPEDRKAIFERFRRLPTHESGPVSGAGLGLSIASDLVQAMGGSIELESEVGVGSTFTFTIPCRIVPRPAKQSSDSWAAPWNPRGYRILLCEDNRLNARLATQVLTRLGVDHAVAYDGKAALELLAREHFDAVLLDLHMPHRNGFEVTQCIRHSDPPHPLADIPILALTADASEETRKKTREAGMDDFLAKPFHLPELEERLRRLLRRHPSPETHT
jgi:CheY-like chemotaxis protein